MRSGLVLIFLAMALTLRAELPVLIEEPWTGYFAGKEDRRARYKIAQNGRVEIYFLRDDDKELRTPDAELRPFVQVGSVQRKFKKAQLNSTQEATTEPGEVIFVATLKDGGQVRVTYTFGKRELFFAAELVSGNGVETEAIPGFELKVKSVYSSYFSKKDFDDSDWRDKTRGQKMVFDFANGESLRAKLHEPFAEYQADYGEQFAGGVVGATLKSDALGDGDFQLVLQNGVSAVFAPYGDGDRMARNGTFTFLQPGEKPLTKPWGYLKAD